MADPTVKVIANANNKNFPTVNIVTTKAAHTKTHNQKTGTIATADQGNFKIVQDSGGTIAGFKTIHIAGYSGPG